MQNYLEFNFAQPVAMITSSILGHNVSCLSPLLQYIHPSDSHKLDQAELVVVDEAAAIPLPLVRRLMGPYLVFMASTING